MTSLPKELSDAFATYQTEQTYKTEDSPDGEATLSFQEAEFPSEMGENSRKRIDFLDVTNEDFTKYEILDLEGNRTNPSTFNIFDKDSQNEAKPEMNIPSMSPFKSEFTTPEQDHSNSVQLPLAELQEVCIMPPLD